MSLEEFVDLGYEVSDEKFYELDNYELVELNDLTNGDKITGEVFARLFIGDEDYKNDSMQFNILSTDDNGIPINVRFYCQIPKPVHWTPDGIPLCTVFKDNKYERNTYYVIFSILKLLGMKNIYDENGNPVNSFKNISAQRYIEILSEQKEITIQVKDVGEEDNTLEIINIKK